MSKVRLTLDLSDRLHSNVSRLSQKHTMTKADVLRKALEFYFAADEAADDGFRVGAWKDEGTVRKEREFLIR